MAEGLVCPDRECGRLDWLLLTKRPQNTLKMLPSDWGDGYPNVWLGITAEDQTYFDQRWKHLQKIPTVIKFISYEPAIGPLRLPTHGPHPDWRYQEGKWWWGPARKATVDLQMSLRIVATMASPCFISSGGHIE